MLLLGTLITKRVEVGTWFHPKSPAAMSILATVAPSAGTLVGGPTEMVSPTALLSPPIPPLMPSGHDTVELDPDVSSHKAAVIDTVLLSNLIVMLGDQDDMIRAAGIKYLKKISIAWSVKHEGEEGTLPFVRAFAPFILHNISGGILSSWTTDSKARQINALTALIVAVRDLCEYTHHSAEKDKQEKAETEDTRMEVDNDNADGAGGGGDLAASEELQSPNQRQRVTSELLTSRLLPQILDALATTARDESVEIRNATEACCVSIGFTVATAASSISTNAQDDKEETNVAYSEGISALLAYLVPRVQGALNGLDTAYHRTSALTLLTYIVQGIGSIHTTPRTEKSDVFIADLCVCQIAESLADPCLYEFRDVPLRESALLLSRFLYKVSAHFTQVCQDNRQYQCQLLQSLVYLCGRCAFEDTSIPRAAKRELTQFAETMETKAIYATVEEKLLTQLSLHFEKIVATITTASNTNAEDNNNNKEEGKITQMNTKGPQPLHPMPKPCASWTPDSAHRAAFEALVRECPRAAWQQHAVVLSEVIIPLVQPPANLVKGTPEEIASTYAAQRGDLSFEGTNEDGSVDTRLGMLALLETLLRNGSSDWECSGYIAGCCDTLIDQALIPNLVWRAGRVEGVARKVTLTATYGLLKAGAIGPQSLYKHAPHLVPLLASEIEDQDASARHLGCLCLSIIFERLKGGFGEQAVLDIYPRLLKRLDDSDDVIRIAVCDTFKHFMLCAPKTVYGGTMITYTLDQLFIHLDDPDPKIQKSIFDVLVHIAEYVDSGLVLKKANGNIQSHRTPIMCETVIRAIKKLSQ